MNQRGSVGIYFLFSLLVAAAAGYGAYHYIHEHKSELQSEEQASTAPAPKPPAPTTPAPPLPEAPVPAPEVPVVAPEVVAETPALIAARRAVDPIADQSTSPTFGTPGIAGGIEKGSVDRRFKPRAEQLQSCYENASSFDGSVRVMLEVDPSGKLARVSLDDGDDGFQACVISVLDFGFSATKDGKPATIVQPIHFQ